MKPPIVKRTRPSKASPALNAQELAWWETNGALMSRLWDYDDAINRQVRGHYVARARDFLAASGGATILELGCGSGWLGRMLAGPDVNVIGVDFSQTQVDAAVAAAQRDGLAGRCRYLRRDGLEDFGLLNQVDGVLIHAFLHHLDEHELDSALDTLKKGLKPDARLWIYEPAFYDALPANPTPLKPETALQLEACEKLFGTLKGWLLDKGMVQRRDYDEFLERWGDSERNGWYLSPKEVPLEITDFTARLQSRFSVTATWWATIRIIGWLFEINLITDPALRTFLVETFLPMLVRTDQILAGQEAWLRTAMVRPDHAFHVWECVA